MDIHTRLAALGTSLPKAPAPAANYVPFVQTGSMIYVSGQLPFLGDDLLTGKLGSGVPIETGVDAARLCVLALLAQMDTALAQDWSRFVRVVKLTGFVNSAPDFTDQPKVVNGASDFLVAVLGDAGRHARSAVGVAALPMDAAVEIEGIFEVTP